MQMIMEYENTFLPFFFHSAALASGLSITFTPFKK